MSCLDRNVESIIDPRPTRPELKAIILKEVLNNAFSRMLSPEYSEVYFTMPVFIEKDDRPEIMLKRF
jgi:hypothetical protein